MKKLLFIIGILFLLTGCEVVKNDPTLKESERIAVLTKMQSDTLVTAVEVDNTIYHVKNDVIVSSVPKTSGQIIVLCIITLLLGFLFGIILTDN